MSNNNKDNLIIRIDSPKQKFPLFVDFSEKYSHQKEYNLGDVTSIEDHRKLGDAEKEISNTGNYYRVYCGPETPELEPELDHCYAPNFYTLVRVWSSGHTLDSEFAKQNKIWRA